MHLAHALPVVAIAAALLVAACEKSPAPFHRVDGVWHYESIPVPGADAPTFTPLGEHYAKDRARVYYADTYRDGREYFTVAHPRVRVLGAADAATFRYLASDYAVDASSAYFQGARYLLKDAATFALLDYGFSRDRVTGYCHLEPIAGSDGATFAGLGAHYARDATRVYYCGVELDDAGKPPYVKAVALAGAQPASFKELERGYAVDARQAYFQDKVLRDADAATFAVQDAGSGPADARDARGGFDRGQRLPSP